MDTFPLSPQAIKRAQGTVLHILKNTEDAEDALQDALLLALQKQEQYRGDARISTWFTRIAINCALMHKRKRHPERFGFVENFDELVKHEPDVEQEAIRHQRAMLLHNAIRKLSPRRRRATYRHLQGEVSTSAEKALRFNAREDLRRMLGRTLGQKVSA